MAVKSLEEILSIADEPTRKMYLRDYELEKVACEHDSGPRCGSCERAGTASCFNPQKGRDAWKWRH